MVSAVHRDLSQSEADDPRLYVSYARFMGSLERDMPAVHEHVVTTWVQSRHPERPALSSPQPASPALLRPEPAVPDDAPLIEGDTLESAPPARALADTGLRQFIRAVQMDVGAAEGPEEPGEPGEQHSESAGSAREPRSAVAAETQDEDDPQEDEEPDPRSSEKLEGAAEEEEPVEPDDREGSRDEQELEPEELNDEEQSRGQEAEEQETSVEEDQGPESEETSDAEPGSGGGGSRLGGAENPAAEETEWPSEEHLEPAEDLEEFESGESEAAPPE